MLVGGRPQVLWEGLAELRADAPSKARGAEGERGRRRAGQTATFQQHAASYNPKNKANTTN